MYLLHGVPSSVQAGGLSDVKSLKQQLHRLRSLPARFRQRLFHGGSALHDAAKLDSPRDLELVVLSYHAESETRAAEMVTAARNGFVSQVRLARQSLNYQ